MAVHPPMLLSPRLSESTSSAAGHPDIILLLERPRKDGELGTIIETVNVFSGESIADIKLRLRAKQPWFTKQNILACGDRELLDHEIVGRVAGSSADFLHVFVRLADVQTLSATGHQSRASLDYSQPVKASPRSLLTASLAQTRSSDSKSIFPGSEGVLQVGGTDRGSETCADTILHLIVRRGAHVNWHSHNDQFELAVAGHETAEAVTRRIEMTHKLPASSIQLIYQGQVLAPNRPLASYGLGKGCLLELQPIEPRVVRPLPWGSPPLSSPQHGLYAKWQQARAGLASGHSPTLAAAGCGGSYFIPDDQGQKVAVFKPADEEPLAVNNPREVANSGSGSPSSDGYGLRKGVVPGEGAYREVAAFVLDHGHFAGVPPTALVSCQGFANEQLADGKEGMAVKVGSLQAFISSDTDCEEQGSSAFPVQEVHKIAVLDIRLVNTDRNGANVLAKRCQDASLCSWQLTPIDHGYCLPGTLQDVNFEWLWWPQAVQPFDAATLAYIQGLDADTDLETLAAHDIPLRPECKRVFKVGTLVLKLGASKGCTAQDIGNLMTRQGLGKSPLEKLHARAVNLAIADESANESSVRAQMVAHRLSSKDDAPMGVGRVGDDAYFGHLQRLLHEYFDQLLQEEGHQAA